MSESVSAAGATAMHVQILLAEYSGLRAHVVARTAAAIQTITIGAASLALTVPQLEEHREVGIRLLVAIVLVVVAVGTSIATDLRRETTQIRAIETRINGLAGHRLLTYETNRHDQRTWLTRAIKGRFAE